MTEPNDNKTTVDVCYIETRPRGRPRKYGEKGSKFGLIHMEKMLMKS